MEPSALQPSIVARIHSCLSCSRMGAFLLDEGSTAGTDVGLREASRYHKDVDF
jgi:hypothetical protein